MNFIREANGLSPILNILDGRSEDPFLYNHKGNIPPGSKHTEYVDTRIPFTFAYGSPI